MCDHMVTAYLLSSGVAASAALQSDVDMFGELNLVRVSTTMTSLTSHMRLRRLCHGTGVKPSGRFPSPMSRPVGSFVAETSARFKARQSRQ